MAEDIDLGRFFEVETSNKLYVDVLYLHGIENEILLDYKIDFELNGLMVIGVVELKASIRFKSIAAFETYINAINVD